MVSSIFSPNGQMQTAAPVCHSDPGALASPFNRTHKDIKVHVRFTGWDSGSNIFNVDRTVNCEWRPADNNYRGDDYNDYGIHFVISPDFPTAGTCQASCQMFFVSPQTRSHRFNRPTPPTYEPWTPAPRWFLITGYPYLGSLTGWIEMFRP